MPTPTPTPVALTLPGLESVYDTLAEAIDLAPAALRELMLVKLVVLLAHDLGDAERFAELAHTALQDL